MSQSEESGAPATAEASALSEHETHPQVVDMNQSAESVELRKSTRDKKLALKAKESKSIELTNHLIISINKQLQSNEEFLEQLHECDLEQIEQFLNELNNNTVSISTIFEETKSINDDCAISNQKIVSFFSQYEADVKTVRIHSAEQQERIAAADDEEEQELENAERLVEEAKQRLDEEMKRLEEQMEARRLRMQRRMENTDRTTHQQQGNAAGNNEVNDVSEIVQTDKEPSRVGVSMPVADMQHRTSSLSSDSLLRDSTVPTPDSSTRVKPTILSPLPSITAISEGTSSEESGAFKQLTQCLINSLSASKLPPPEPTVFRGDPINYHDWELSFNSLIETKGLSEMEKLHYLRRYVDGEAKECLGGFFLYNNQEAYAEAKKLLQERFGNTFEVARAFRTKLANWPNLPSRDVVAMRRFTDFLTQCASAMNGISELKILDDNQENEKMTRKLPEWMRFRWGRVVADHKRAQGKYPTFKKFVKFVRDETEILAEPILQYSSTTRPEKKPQAPTQRNTSIRSYNLNSNENPPCLCCSKGNHKTTECFVLKGMSQENRNKFVMDNRLCYGCLQPNHRSSQCKKKAKCNTCKKYHPTALHQEQYRPHQHEQLTRGQTTTHRGEATKEEVSIHAHATKQTKNALLSMIVPVYVSSGDHEELVYALLDTQADASFITRDIAEKIKPPGCLQETTITTMTGETTKLLNKYTVNVRGFGVASKNVAQLNVFEQATIPCHRNQIPDSSHAASHNHLRKISKEVPPKMDIPIGLLIGVDCSKALAPLETILGKDGQPFAVKTYFGWTLCGETDLSRKRVCVAQTVNEYSDDNDSQKVSQDDLNFIKILENGLSKTDEGTYCLPLPFKEKPILPNNRLQAERRLQQLLQRFKKDELFKQEYFQFVGDMIKRGHAEAVPKDGATEAGKVWYIPHFGVMHPKKKKLRVVFDASAKYNNQSLNELLLTGPDHMNSLVGILLRFRNHNIGLSCDIEKMFHNFQVDQQDRDFLRFLWMDESMNDISEYRMTVHLFGAASSPGVATFALRKIAKSYQEKKPQASRFITNNFYVDDGITSVDKVEDAISLAKDAAEICNSGNLRLHKFLSNDKNVLDALPESERVKTVQDIDLFGDKLPTERTLGLEWCVKTDTIEFRNNLRSKPATRRGILSVISQIYDPLGLLSPFILQGKAIMQKACQEKGNWDDEVTEEIKDSWSSWTSQLKELDQMKIERCIKPKDFGEITHAELHHFSDASLEGYGACSYLRIINKNEKVHVSLVIGKARVAPLKTTTIPRLELQSAVEATRLSTLLRKELGLHIDDEFYWSDSTVALSYIKNGGTRFKMFVANRVQEIRNNSDADQWFHIAGKENPADIASRGATLRELKKSTWWTGPEFLRKLDITSRLNKEINYSKDLSQDPEIKEAKKALITASQQDTSLSSTLNHFSSWPNMKRAVANAKSMIRSKSWKKPTLSTQDLQEAEEIIIKASQIQFFGNAISDLKRDRTVKKQCKIIKLTPFLDQKGVLRMNGRTQKSSVLTFEEKNPVILDKSSHLATTIVRHFHEKIHHQGRSFTLSAIRQAGFWITGALSLVKNVVNKCVKCKRIRARPLGQQMGLLPPERIEASPPFTHVGVDAFGPFIVKDRRSEIKRWGVVFTCMYSRAVHIEVLEDLTTDSFLQALRCFQAVRGPIKTLFSDCGTNFIGGRNELEKELANMKDEKLKEYLRSRQIIFKTNTPGASHQGGTWERQIRTIRSVLNGMAPRFSQRLNTAALRTAFYEVTATINSRPLSVNCLNTPDQVVITPNHLLTSKSSHLPPPPGEFDNEEIYGNKMYRKTQQLANEFWTMWKTYYLSQIEKRSRWESPKEELKIGDVVTIVDDNTKRNMWRIGQVTEVKKGADGLVRNASVRLAGQDLDRRGRLTTQEVVLDRPVQKLVIIMRV